MEDQSHVRRIPLSLVAAFSALFVAAGSGAAWFTWNSLNPNLANRAANTTTSDRFNTSQLGQSQGASSSQAQQPDNTQPGETNVASPAQSQTAQVYWLRDTGKNLELVPSAIALNTATQPEERLESAFDQLLKGPIETTVASTIPSDTKLLRLSIEPDGVHVDLSKAFTSGGGSTSMTGRVAQVLYTATSLEPTAKVWLSVEGKPLNILGGEGLVLDQPLTRQTFERDFAL